MGRFVARALVVSVVLTAAVTADAMPGKSPIRLPVTVRATASSVTVQPGDHLWRISATRLAEDLGREATDAEIWPYWREVIASNLSALRSGDPDLIYPGEVIELPDR